MKILCHVVTHDTGLALNPFHGFCTSALCTPSHRDAKLDPGDWIVGHTSASAPKPRHIVYAMKVSEILGLNSYFRDPRFEAKKPKPGTPEQQCGDNIYYNIDSKWRRIRPSLHDDDKSFRKDIGKGDPKAFISDHFFYFGGNAPPFGLGMAYMIHPSQGYRYVRGDDADAFLDWLQSTHGPPGRKGLPRDFEKASTCRPGSCAPPSKRRGRA